MATRITPPDKVWGVPRRSRGVDLADQDRCASWSLPPDRRRRGAADRRCSPRPWSSRAGAIEPWKTIIRSGPGRDRDAVEQHPARGGLQEAPDRGEQRGLAAPGRTDKHHALGLGDRQAHFLHRRRPQPSLRAAIADRDSSSARTLMSRARNAPGEEEIPPAIGTDRVSARCGAGTRQSAARLRAAS